MADSNIARYFLVDDKNDSGLAQDLLNSGALPQDIVPSDSVPVREDVRFDNSVVIYLTPRSG
jgi:hypothetical protein